MDWFELDGVVMGGLFSSWMHDEKKYYLKMNLDWES